MLTKIAITNFKGIKDRVEIDLKPITLLFGANSAGKSTVLHALQFARELIRSNNPDVTRTEIGGDSFDLGGFRHCVHGGFKPDSEITIELTSTIDREFFDYDISFEYLTKVPEEEMLTPALKTWLGNPQHWYDSYSWTGGGLPFSDKITTATISISISEVGGKPVVHQYSASINDSLVGTIVVSKSGDLNSNAHLEHFSPKSPLIPPFFWNSADFRESNAIEPEAGIGEVKQFSPQAFRKFMKEAKQTGSGELFDWQMEAEQIIAESGGKLPVQVNSDLHAIPRFGVTPNQAMLTSFLYDFRPMPNVRMVGGKVVRDDNGIPVVEEVSEKDWFKAKSAVALSCYIDILMNIPLSVVARDLFEYRHIGPLRESKVLTPQKTMPVFWINGTSAWKALCDSDETVQLTNKWLNDFGAGHTVSVKRTKRINKDSQFSKLLTAENIGTGRLGELRKLWEASPEEVEVQIHDKELTVALRPKDVGVGISQLLPVLVACLDGDRGSTAIEQPELHLHPKLQTELGDLFIVSTRLHRNYDALAARKKHQEIVDADMHERLPSIHEAMDSGVDIAPIMNDDSDEVLKSKAFIDRVEAMERTCSHQLLIETHSEHLLLRLLRRIRETSKNENPNDETRLTPNDLSVVFLEQVDGATTAKQMKVTEDGDFVGYWPEGFFDERSSELY